MEEKDHLVELGFLEECEPWRLKSYMFPSKVGGKPAWLSLLNIPSFEQIQCKKCNNPMIFLCQIYSPFQNSTEIPVEQVENNFHRTLFIFICRSGSCCERNNSDNIKVFRSSLTRDNQFYPFQPPSEDEPNNNFSLEKWTTLCKVCGCCAEKKCSKCKKVYYCSRQHQVFDWKEIHKMVCGGVDNNQASTVLFPEKEIVIESEELDEITSSVDFRTYEKLAETDKCGTMQNVSDEDLEIYAAQKTDKVFQRFQERVKHNPEQVIRYERGGQPLWIAKQPLPEHVPNCEYCNGPRQFEFQVMPQMLTMLNEQELDWGIIAIYTCKASCTNTNKYLNEFAFKQDVELSEIQTNHE